MAVKILYTQKFLKNFNKRIASNKNLARRFNERIKIFSVNPKYPLLKDHQLRGSKQNLRSFSITGDIRAVYKKISKDKVLLLDIGTHSQVY